MSRRKISIFGSTGSIGKSTLDVIAAHGGTDTYDVAALIAGSNAKLLAAQAIAVNADIAVLRDEAALPELREHLAGTGIEAGAGEMAVLEAAARPVDICVSAIAGAAGLAPTLAAIETGADIALANKESLVCAGPLVRAAAKRCGSKLLPVDSEHNAIFQCLDERHASSIERIILTASGGPFRNRSREEMRDVTPQQAMAHPNWSMGMSISIDSASMFNKGLELIEAEQLFPVTAEQIEIIVHPQSVVHSMVGYTDGSVLAQLGAPDMRTPIAYALGWPRRVSAPVERLDFAKLARLDFDAPDETRFPALRIAREAMNAGGLAPCAMNAAKEVAVEGFVAGQIGFLDVASIVDQVMGMLAHAPEIEDLKTVLRADAVARDAARRAIDARTRKTMVSGV